MARWKKGESGNPKGRKPGALHQTRLMNALGGTGALDELVGVLKQQALSGDTSAAAILMNRLIPALKPTGEAITLDVESNAGHAERADAVLKAMSEGNLSPGDGKLMLDSIHAAAQLSTFKALEERISQLETRSR